MACGRFVNLLRYLQYYQVYYEVVIFRQNQKLIYYKSCTVLSQSCFLLKVLRLIIYYEHSNLYYVHLIIRKIYMHRFYLL